MERDDKTGSMSGLTDNEAKEFHRILMSSMVVFFIMNLIAHGLIWSWRPWFGPY